MKTSINYFGALSHRITEFPLTLQAAFWNIGSDPKLKDELFQWFIPTPIYWPKVPNKEALDIQLEMIRKQSSTIPPFLLIHDSNMPSKRVALLAGFTLDVEYIFLQFVGTAHSIIVWNSFPPHGKTERFTPNCTMPQESHSPHLSLSFHLERVLFSMRQHWPVHADHSASFSSLHLGGSRYPLHLKEDSNGTSHQHSLYHKSTTPLKSSSQSRQISLPNTPHCSSANLRTPQSDAMPS
ncbi:hypothetical protein M422DRAFT_242552 [Sphaerobolus stellatus SS14]|nr:hypothetical protein M422DRAFT_242552 [Sphaerobolus stellatus SS14]